MTDTTPKAEKLKVLADFDMFNRDILMNVLDEHLQKGYMLKRSAQSIGMLTFEPVTAGEDVKYAVIRPAQYENGGILPKPWVKCGRIGDYIIWRSTGAAYIPKPDKDPVEWERSNRNHYIFQGIMWLLIGVLYFTTDVPILFGSARGFSEYFGFRFLRDIVMVVNGVICFTNAFSKKKRDRTERGKLKYFKQYIEPYILIVLIIGLLIFALADIKEKKIPLPDSRLPFSEEFDSGRIAFLEHSYAARNYIYNKTSDEDYMSCFLYEAYFDGLAPKVFEEIRDKGNVYSTENYSGYPLSGRFIFIDPGTVDSPDISGCPYLDDIIVCREYDKYDGQHTFGGLIVRSGNSIFGIAYYKDDFSQEEILQYLNDFFAGT